MKNTFNCCLHGSLFLFLILTTVLQVAHAQNVGIATSTPLTKLHIAGNTSTIRLEGVSSTLSGTHILAPALSTDKILFVNASGDFKAIPNGTSGQVLTISASGIPGWSAAASGTNWLLTGNAATVAGTNFIGTTDAVDWVVKTTGSERMRVAAAGNIGVNVTPSLTERFYITDASQTTTLRVNTTNLATGSKALHANGISGTDTYLGYVGAITLSSTSVINAGVYSTVTSGTSGAIIGSTTGGTGSGVYGFSSVANGGRFTNTIGTASAMVGANLTASGVGTGNGVNGSTIQSAGFGVIGSNTNTSGTGVLGIGSNVAGTYLLNGSGGAFNGAGVAVFALAKTAASGTGILSAGNNLAAFSTLSVGSGGAFNGTSYGLFSFATTAASGTGILGIGNNLGTFTTLTGGSGAAFNGITVGAFGLATTVASGIGMLGMGNNITAFTTPTAGAGGAFNGNAIGVYTLGKTAASGIGVVGVGNNIVAFTTPATGAGGAFNGAGIGSYSLATTAASGIGVIGLGNNITTLTSPATGAGGAFNGNSYGSYAIAKTAASGIGVVGLGNNIATLSAPASGAGGAFNGTSIGSYAYASTAATGIGVIGLGNNITTVTSGTAGSGGVFNGTTLGTLGFSNTAASGVGVMGAGNNITSFTLPVAGSGVNANGFTYGITAYSSSNSNGTAGSPSRAGGYFQSGSGAGLSYAYVASEEGAGVPRKIVGNGTVNTIVKDLTDHYVLLSAPETPENLFMDYGTGQLQNGKVHITIDPILSKNIEVNDAHPLRVFVQLEGDCKGVYVTNKTSTGFDVVELQGGTSNISFSWNVVANRADESYGNFADERFPRHSGPPASVSVPASSTAVSAGPTTTDLSIQNVVQTQTGNSENSITTPAILDEEIPVN
jgi:hypothetical protein